MQHCLLQINSFLQWCLCCTRDRFMLCCATLTGLPLEKETGYFQHQHKPKASPPSSLPSLLLSPYSAFVSFLPVSLCHTCTRLFPLQSAALQFGRVSTLPSLLLINTMICLVCSHYCYLPLHCPCGLQWYPIYPQTEDFHHIAPHTHKHTQTHSALASSPLCLAGMLINEWTLLVIPYLCNLNTDGVLGGAGGHPAGVTPEELHLSLPAEPRATWTVKTESAPWMLCLLHLCFISHICEADSVLYPCFMWWYTGGVQTYCREMHIKRYWLPSTIKGPFCWVVCQLLRAFIRLQTFTSQQAHGADGSFIWQRFHFFPKTKKAAVSIKLNEFGKI